MTENWILANILLKSLLLLCPESWFVVCSEILRT